MAVVLARFDFGKNKNNKRTSQNL